MPRDRIIARYDRCLANLVAAAGAIETSLIFDNSTIEAPLQLVAMVHAAQNGDCIVNQRLPAQILPIWWKHALHRLAGVRTVVVRSG